MIYLALALTGRNARRRVQKVRRVNIGRKVKGGTIPRFWFSSAQMTVNLALLAQSAPGAKECVADLAFANSPFLLRRDMRLCRDSDNFRRQKLSKKDIL
jgi:hypothetical protein